MTMFPTTIGVIGGAGLNVVRIPISSSDFDLTPSWTLDDQSGDTSLSHFTMAPLQQHTIPAVLDVLASNPDVKIMLSPWSAPAWMKDSNDIGYGTLRNEHV
jgi:glucosylceramidase